ncbi:Rpn family recombination-promoting nuclease/putative transposase [Thermoanaerobacter sp. RKWS2]|uniref:Rpn family recombination-promoting nuclease/putative transposase n=1 Tax=Thermoanaerobacter sp. RKWS2 TaxID=2983842 RepID=UPI00224B7CCB|nr:Rpn family recombination-promoting nuclease/putative transposase [Thermoanaerobacter sp. RKWS2]UZQ81838.1 Rpn family recombination-promoting nuclease/putative transposase [Thermoanaerobacter sp. RKWS2]
MAKKKNNYDSPDKVFLKSFIDEFARDILGFKNATEIEITDSNVQISAELRTDTVFLIKNKGSNDVILHIEVQTSNDEDMAKRMHDYRFFLKERYPGKDILQMVFYIGREKPRMKNVYEEKIVVNVPQLNVNFVSMTKTEFGIIDIGEKTVEQILRSRNHLLLSFLCLAERDKRNKNPNAFIKDCIEKAKESFKAPEEQGMLKTVYEGIAVHAPLAGVDKNFVRELFKDMEVNAMIDVKQLPLYEDVYEEGKIQGKIEGKMEVAKKLLKLGMDIDKILEITELSKEDLEKIEKVTQEEIVNFYLNKEAGNKKNIKL